MSKLVRIPSLAAVVVTLVAAGSSRASAGPDDGPVHEVAIVTTTTDPHPVDPQYSGPGRCDGLDHDLLDVDLDDTGEITFVYAGDDYATCDEVMVVTSYASAGPEVDNHDDPVVDEVVLQVAQLEAAGPDGVTVEVELDECWAGVQVLRDGDTLVFEDVIGDGCEPHSSAFSSRQSAGLGATTRREGSSGPSSSATR